MKMLQALDAIRGEAERIESNKPSWKHRRRLIYVAVILGVVMILFGLATFWWDRQVSTEAVIGGVALISIVLTAYVGGASYEDSRLYREPQHEIPTSNPE